MITYKKKAAAASKPRAGATTWAAAPVATGTDGEVPFEAAGAEETGTDVDSTGADVTGADVTETGADSTGVEAAVVATTGGE